MKAAYKWILNNRYVAYITDEDAYASFIMDTVLSRRYYSDGTGGVGMVAEPDVILSLNGLTEEEYKNNYNNLKLLYEASGETIGITSDYVFPVSYSEFYSNDTFYCREEGTDFTIEASGVTLNYGETPRIEVETQGVSSAQNISVGFGLPKGPQGLSGETMGLIIRSKTIDNGEEMYAETREGENSTYILDFGLPRGPQGNRGDKGLKGDTGLIGTPMEIFMSGTTGENIGRRQAVVTGATGYYYSLGFTLKKGDQGDKGDGNASAETITREAFCQLMMHGEIEEKIYVVVEVDNEYSIYFGETLIYPDYMEEDCCECDCDEACPDDGCPDDENVEDI